jgi:anaerobic ribonucleoside-triphosphate reductase activating protein
MRLQISSVEDSYLYVDSISCPVTNLGPGKRIVLWLEGCSLKCNGCMAVSMQKKKEYHKRSVIELISVIKDASEGLDGITISGGEPFEQSESLFELVQLIRRETNLNILVYSGYTIEELREFGDVTNKVLEVIDILIDGRFEQQNTNKKLWRGSDNQDFHILSRLANKYSHYANAEYHGKRELSIEMIGDYIFKVIGVPERGFLEDLEKTFKKKGFLLTRPFEK